MGEKERYVGSKHVTKCVILLDDFERSSVWDFGVFRHFDTASLRWRHSLGRGLTITGQSAHDFSPSPRTYNSNSFVIGKTLGRGRDVILMK